MLVGEREMIPVAQLHSCQWKQLENLEDSHYKAPHLLPRLFKLIVKPFSYCLVVDRTELLSNVMIDDHMSISFSRDRPLIPTARPL